MHGDRIGGYGITMGTVQQDFDTSIEDVLAVLADGWLYATWVVGASRIRDVDPDWPAAQARIHHSAGIWPAVVDDATIVLEWLPPHRMKLQARGWPAGEATVTIDLEPLSSGCRVTLNEDITKGPFTLVPKPLRSALLNYRNRECLRRLGFLATGRAAGGGDPEIINARPPATGDDLADRLSVNPESGGGKG